MSLLDNCDCRTGEGRGDNARDWPSFGGGPKFRTDPACMCEGCAHPEIPHTELQHIKGGSPVTSLPADWTPQYAPG